MKIIAKHKSIILILTVVLIGDLAIAASIKDKLRKKEVLSKVYHVDQIYKSMMGPYSTENVYLLETKEPEVLWITGYKAVMKGKDGKSNMAQEFMCHSNLDFQTTQHRKQFAYGDYAHSRLFTLSQGQFEVEFPEGFGIPVMSNLPLFLTTQVLNLNHHDKEIDVRHKVTIEFEQLLVGVSDRAKILIQPFDYLLLK